MTRQDIAANGINQIFCLVVRGTCPHEYLCPPNRLHELTSTEEERAEFFVREIDAREMLRRAEHLTGFRFEVIRRPTLLGGESVGYCPTCGHTGDHNPFCGTLREPDRVRLKDGSELPITVTELAAGMATATFRREGADRG